MMNKKAKFSRYASRFFFSVIGTSCSKAFLSYIYKRKLDKHPFSFPIDKKTVKEIIIILPDQELEILYQLKNILSLVSVFKNASISLFCEETVSSYVKMVPNVKIIEYRKEELNVFGPESRNFSNELMNDYDICILLDRSPELSKLSLLSMTNAPVRAGYEGAGEYPFLNLKARSTLKAGYLSEKNCLLSELFGKNTEPLRMSIAKKTIDEIDFLLKQAQIFLNDKGPIGIDALFLIKCFGENWFNSFVCHLQKVYSGKIYFYISETPSPSEFSCLQQYKIPAFSELTPPKTAALIYRSDLVITGNTILYGLAALLNMPAFGFFTENEMATYCPDTPLLKGVVYKKLPEDQSVQKLFDFITNGSLKKNKM